MADNTELHGCFQKAYLESDPTRKKELLQKEMNAEWTTVFKIGKSSYSAKASKTTAWAKQLRILYSCLHGGHGICN